MPTEVPILYEDEYLLAVDKPAKLPVHPTARYHHNTLIKVLQRARPDTFLSLGHRIDRETSGVLLVAKTAACDRALKRDLENRAGIEKIYTAITWGVPVAEGETLRVDKPLELDPTSKTRVKMRVGTAALREHDLPRRRRSPTSTRSSAANCSPAANTKSASTSRRSIRPSSATSSTASTKPTSRATPTASSTKRASPTSSFPATPSTRPSSA